MPSPALTATVCSGDFRAAMQAWRVVRYQRAALYSFTYNVGVSAFRSSTLLKKLNNGDRKGACDELRKWTWAGGKQWKGLQTRREIERELCRADKANDL